MIPVPAPILVPVSIRSGSQEESGHANELMRKMEEMKSKKEEEQRLKREKRISDRSVYYILIETICFVCFLETLHFG